MSYKELMYSRERESLQREKYDAQAKAAAFVRQARSGGEDALADETTSKWDIAERVVSRWQSLVLQSSSLDRIIKTAQERRDLLNSTIVLGLKRKEFALAIETLVADYTSLSILLESVADLVDSFVKKPLIASSAFVNFILMGNPGVGKTRLAGSLAAVLGKLGIFIYEQLVECGRSDFVAEFEGQTAAKTRNFLMGNLEKTIFLDEAYSLTTWEQPQGPGTDRKLSGYSGEAVTEIVAFLSQRTGSVGFIAAGYEYQMINDFLPSNPGLSRRFNHRIWLADYSPEELVSIYLTALSRALSDPPPSPRLTISAARSFFTDTAISFLVDVLGATNTRNSESLPYPILNRVFSAQAGAMNTLANVTAVLVASSQRRGQIGVSQAGLDTWALSFTDVYDILATLLLQLTGPQASDALGELQQIGKENGWLVSGVWQIPPDRVRVLSQSTRERTRKVR